MDSKIDLANLRSQLMALPWDDLRNVAGAAGVSASTADKIRRNIAKEPGFTKILALHKALASYIKKQARKTAA